MFGISGLLYIPHYISQPHHDFLIETVDAQPWRGDLARRTQHYGYVYDYRAKSVDPASRLGDLPPWLQRIAFHLAADGLMSKAPDQAIINEYASGQGIASHIDCVPCFDDVVGRGKEFVFPKKGRCKMRNEPVTKLDPRYSVPDGVATSWEETRRVLETAEMFWLSTVRTDGRPHVTPLVAVWHDDALHFNTADTSQKAVNLRGNPHVILTTGCSNQWTEGLDVVVEGDAVQVTDDEALFRLARAWTTKWDGGWQFQVRNGSFQLGGDTILVFSVTPTKVFAFAKGHISHTRHQF